MPYFEEMILEDIRPTDSWIGNIATGVFPAHTGVAHNLDRFRHVFPNTTKVWNATQYTACLGTPCDKHMYNLGFGSDRVTFHLEEQSWRSPLFCFDQLMHVTHSAEQLEQIISKILRPATSAIMSAFLRKRALFWSDRKFVVNATMPQFTYTWTAVGDEEYFFDCSAAPATVGKLAPQHLQSRWTPLMLNGYAGMNPFKDTAPFIELVTGMETCWELDRLGGSQGVGGVPSVAGNWRFTEWTAADKYWRYGFSGQVGNFQVRVDPMELRFNYRADLGPLVGANRYRYQLVLPYTNSATGGAGGAAGLGDAPNEDFLKAPFRLSFIMHKKGMTALVSDATSINPEMPFMARDFGGRWQFVQDNLGTDVNGCVIENMRRNKGLFIADFKLAIRPEHTEFINVFFHKGEPNCLPFIDTCTTDPGYPVQHYSSDPGYPC